jgi:hypothetical protein
MSAAAVLIRMPVSIAELERIIGPRVPVPTSAVRERPETQVLSQKRGALQLHHRVMWPVHRRALVFIVQTREDEKFTDARSRRTAMRKLTESKPEDTSVRELDHAALDAVSGGLLGYTIAYMRTLVGSDRCHLDDALQATYM